MLMLPYDEVEAVEIVGWGVNQTRVGIATGGLSEDDVQEITALMKVTGAKTN
ncbi:MULTISPECIES: hypothetical protein [Rhizobium]|uniref:hypothetical protein n=1 Tax=Rhizobium TaxID=379 RepID=UPI0013EF513E|nr:MULTISPECIES: hypothetical protein [Rhizobium]WSH79876.1 hypothetical protein U8P69_21995 [Rhizobium beringeri]